VIKILIIEDDPVLNKNIKEALLEEKMQVEDALNGFIAEKKLKKDLFDCIVLDINIPCKDGFQIAKEFRKYNASTPILILTAFDELEDKIKGFESGADDYLTKPFFMKELILRINSLIKRNRTVENRGSKTITAGDIAIQTDKKMVTRQGKEVKLTPREYDILLYLISFKGNLVPKKDLMKEIWGNTFDATANTIEVYINFLRNKLDKPFGKDSIKTKIGYGYYFENK
jgi:DNA-binding response OmpR family regulator